MRPSGFIYLCLGIIETSSDIHRVEAVVESCGKGTSSAKVGATYLKEGKRAWESREVQRIYIFNGDVMNENVIRSVLRILLQGIVVRTAEFAHVFLFRCPECHGAIASVCFNFENSLEMADEEIFRPTCDCGWIGELNGFMAMRHWVQSWETITVKDTVERARPTEAA
jgi:hypothetical protein